MSIFILTFSCPRELSSIGMDNTHIIQGPRFETRPPQKKYLLFYYPYYTLK